MPTNEMSHNTYASTDYFGGQNEYPQRNKHSPDFQGRGLYDGPAMSGNTTVSGYRAMTLNGPICADCLAPVEALPSAHSFCARCAYKPENLALWGKLPGDGRFRG